MTYNNKKNFFLFFFLILLISLCPFLYAADIRSYIDLSGSNSGNDKPRIAGFEERCLDEENGLYAVSFDVYFDRMNVDTKIGADGSYALFYFRNASFSTELGQPKLPVISERINIPGTAIPVSLEILETSSKEFSDYRVYPVPRLEQKIDEHGLSYIDEVFVKDENAYSSGKSFPLSGKTAELGNEIWIRDKKGVTVNVYPVHFESVRNRVKVFTHIKFQVIYRLSNINSSGVSSSLSPGALWGDGGKFDKMYKNIFLNFEGGSTQLPASMGAATLAAGAVSKPANLLSASNKADYLIITAPSFYNSTNLEAFANHRAGHSSLDVAIVSLSSVYAQFPAATNDESIKQVIRQAYTSWAKPVQYVLLIGDADTDGEQQTWFCPSHTKFSYITDNWYVCFNDSSPMVPSIMIGRFPSKTEAELSAMTQKTIQFDNDTSGTNDWGTRQMLYCGYGYAQRCDKFSSVSEPMRQLALTLPDKKEIDEVVGDQVPAAELPNMIYNMLKSGTYLFSTYRGHGWEQGWEHYSDARLPTMSSTHKMIVFSMTCLTGAFDYKYYDGYFGTNCMGEIFLKNASGGAVAFLGGSRTNGGSDALLMAIWDSIFSDGIYVLGNAIMQAKVLLPNDWNIDIYNLLGDPALDFSHLISSASNKPEPVVTGFGTSQFTRTYVAGPVNKIDFNIDIENKGDSAISNLPLALYKENMDGTEIKFADLSAVNFEGCGSTPGANKKTVNYTWYNPPSGCYNVILRTDPANALDELFDYNYYPIRIQNIPYKVTVGRFTDTGGNSGVDIYRNRIAWTASGGYSYVKYADIGNNILNTVGPGRNLTFCNIFKDKIISREAWHFYVFDLSTGYDYTTPECTSAGIYAPEIYGDHMVWQQSVGNTSLIGLANVTDGTCQFLPQGTSHQVSPDIYGDTIVWNEKYDIYMYHLSDGVPARLPMQNFIRERPSIYGDNVVAETYLDSTSYIYSYNIRTGFEKNVTSSRSAFARLPHICGDLVAFNDHRNNGSLDIFLAPMSGKYEISLADTPGVDESRPRISGNRIVWTSNGDIYMACVTPAAFTANDVFAAADADSSGQKSIVVNFGQEGGIWATALDKQWSFIHPCAPKRMAAGNVDGIGQLKNDLAVDFGASYGIWIRYDNGQWAIIHNMSGDDLSCGDINGDGRDEVIVNFGNGYGLWSYVSQNSVWDMVHPISPEAMVVADVNGDNIDDLAIDFGGEHGIWIRDGHGVWSKLHNISPDQMISANLDGDSKKDLVIDFGDSFGLWAYFSGTGIWRQLNNVSPRSLAAGNIDGDADGIEDIAADFGEEYGIWVLYDLAGWDKIHPYKCERMIVHDIDGTGKADIIIDFGSPYGIWVKRDNGAWDRLHRDSAFEKSRSY